MVRLERKQTLARQEIPEQTGANPASARETEQAKTKTGARKVEAAKTDQQSTRPPTQQQYSILITQRSESVGFSGVVVTIRWIGPKPDSDVSRWTGPVINDNHSTQLQYSRQRPQGQYCNCRGLLTSWTTW